MVAITAAMFREKIASGINSVKCSGGAGEVAPKLDHLRRLRAELLAADPRLLVDSIPPVLDLLSEDASPVRRYVTQYDSLTSFCYVHWLELMRIHIFKLNWLWIGLCSGLILGNFVYASHGFVSAEVSVAVK